MGAFQVQTIASRGSHTQRNIKWFDIDTGKPVPTHDLLTEVII